MRFLLGLLLGSLLALQLAGRLDTPSAATVEAHWQTLLREVGARLYPSPEPPAAAMPDHDGAAARQPLKPLAPPAGPDAAVAPEHAPRPLPVRDEPATLEALLAATPAPGDPPAAPDTKGSPRAMQDGSNTAAGGRSPVWVPFHSERSARGFARHLSERLEHPFAVSRQGPGQYQVQFEWQDALQRDELLAALAGATALSPAAGTTDMPEQAP